MSLLYFKPTSGDLSSKRGIASRRVAEERDDAPVVPLLRPKYFGQNQADVLRRVEEFGDCSETNDLLVDYEVYFGRPGTGEITHRKATNHAYKHIANRLGRLQGQVRALAKRELKAWKRERSNAFKQILSRARALPKYKRWTEMKVRYDPGWTNQTAWTLHPLTKAWTPIICPHFEARKLFGVDRMIYDPRFIMGGRKVHASKPRANETPIVSQVGTSDPSLFVGAYQYRIRLRKLNAKQAAKARRAGTHYPKTWVDEQKLIWDRDHPFEESRALTDLRRKVWSTQLELEGARASQECVQWTYEYSGEYIHEVDRAIVGTQPTAWGIFGPALRNKVAQSIGRDSPYASEAHGSFSPRVCIPITYVSGRAEAEGHLPVRFTFNCYPELPGFSPGYSDRNAIALAVKPKWERFEGTAVPVAVDRLADAPDQSAANAAMHKRYFDLADYVVRASVDDIRADRASVEMKDLPETVRSTGEFVRWCGGQAGHLTLHKAARFYLGWKFGVEPLKRDVDVLLSQIRKGLGGWRRAFVQLYKAVYSLVVSPSTVKTFYTLGKTPLPNVYVLAEKPATTVSMYLPVFTESPMAGWQGDVRRDNGWMSWYGSDGTNETSWFDTNVARRRTDQVPDTREYYARYLAGQVVQLSPEHVRWALETFLAKNAAGLWRGLVHERPGALCCNYFREGPEWFLNGCLKRSDRSAWDKILGWAADHNLFQIGWEVAPLSFVLDWFLNTHSLATVVNNMTRAAGDGSRSARAPKEIWGHDRFDWSGYLQMPEGVRMDVRFGDVVFPRQCFPGWGSSWEKSCRVAGVGLSDIQQWRTLWGFAPLKLASEGTWRLNSESLEMFQVPCRAMEIRLYVPHPERAYPTPPRIASRFRRGQLGLRSNEVWDALKPRVQINLDWGKLLTLAALVLSR